MYVRRGKYIVLLVMEPKVRPKKEDVIKAYDILRDAEVDHLNLCIKEDQVKAAVVASRKKVLEAKDIVRSLTGY